jgi:5'-methylthioadenosine phosphorylase
MAGKLLGVIGGSGLYSMKELHIIEKVTVDTPFGAPSEDVVIGELNGTRMAFLPRHGSGHYIPPSEINFRANIFALKKLGVEQIISVSAVGSMKEKLQPALTEIICSTPNFFRAQILARKFISDGGM